MLFAKLIKLICKQIKKYNYFYYLVVHLFHINSHMNNTTQSPRRVLYESYMSPRLNKREYSHCIICSNAINFFWSLIINLNKFI